MIRLPVVDAALEGFRVTRERPRAVAMWGALVFASHLAGLALMVALGLGPVIDAISPLAVAEPSADAAARIAAAAPWLPAVFAFGLAANVVLYTAVLRAVLEPRADRFGYLRLGRQELRQAVLWLYAGAVLFAAWLGVAALLAAGRAAAAALEPQAGALVQAAVAAATFLALFYPAVRLSIAPAETFTGGRVALFSTWKLTQGRFWSMVGSYALAAVLALAVLVLATMVAAPLASALAAATGQGPSLVRRLAQPDLTGLKAFLTVETVASIALDAVMMTLAFVILAAPAPVLCLALRRAAATRR